MRRNILFSVAPLSALLLAALLGGCGDGGDTTVGSFTTAAVKVQKGDPAIPGAAGYVGSVKCRPCHPNKFAGWSNTLHNKPLKYFSELGSGILVNDRDGNGRNDFVDGLNFNNFSSNGKSLVAGVPDLTDNAGKLYANPFNSRKPNAPILSASGGKFFIQMGNTVYEIQRTQGGNGYWKQRYHTKIGNAYYVTPVQYNEFKKQYSAYNDSNWYSGATPFFTDAYGSLALVQAVAVKMVTTAAGPASSSWDNRCAACHQTGLTAEFKDLGNGVPEVVAGYVEVNIGCEACHGPGVAHVASRKASDIINPQNLLASPSLPTGKAGVLLANEVCGKCHARTEGFAQFTSAFGKVKQPVEAPSKGVADAGGNVLKAEFPQVGQSLVGFFESHPGVWGTVTLNGAYGTDPITGIPQMTDFPVYAASRQHHQQWMDAEQGTHGAEKQHGSGLTCWSCHDPHSTAKPHMIRASINGQPTDAHDNTLCLACHNADIGFTGANNMEKVKKHVSAYIGQAKADKITAANFLKPVKPLVLGRYTSARYGFNSYRNGECISCHMPYTASSSGLTFNDNMSYKQGDIRNHTMKTLLTTPGASGANNGPSSCSGCHAIP